MPRLLSAHSAVWPVNVVVGSPGALIVYPMTGVLPTDDGGLKCTLTASSPVLTVTLDRRPGATGAVAAVVTAPEGSEAGPVPSALPAVTVNVYAVPLVSPDTTA